MKAPLFSRYLFVRVDKEAAQLFGAHRQRGVAGFAGRTFSQSLISGRIIEAIKARECPDGFIGLQSALIKAGQKVTILEGPFAAIDAIFSEPKDERRSVLLLSLLGKTHKVVVSNKNLQLVA
jgi:transcriptional antiterminator RfaH